MASDRAMSFGAIAEDYDRLRPVPPAPAVDWLLPPSCRIAIDLAAGTGLFARALASRVAQVVAVEPDRRMAAVLRARSPGVHTVQGRGEAIPLKGSSADAVFVSSAWHWLDPVQAGAEIGRVLRDGGRIGVLWTSRDRDVDWIRELDRLRDPPGSSQSEAADDAAGTDSTASSDSTASADSTASLDGAASSDGAASADSAGHPAAGVQANHGRPRAPRREVSLPEAGPFENVDRSSFAFVRTMTIDEIVGMLGTYSGLIVASPADSAARLARVRAALDHWFSGATQIQVPMRSWCWRADRAHR